MDRRGSRADGVHLPVGARDGTIVAPRCPPVPAHVRRLVPVASATESTAPGEFMTSDIKDCLPPVRDPRKPNLALPRGSIDTHVHVFEQDYPLSPDRRYNPPFSTLRDLQHLAA